MKEIFQDKNCSLDHLLIGDNDGTGGDTVLQLFMQQIIFDKEAIKVSIPLILFYTAENIRLYQGEHKGSLNIVIFFEG